MVRLKVVDSSTDAMNKMTFNSSMVRLKGQIQPVEPRHETVFQFQYGTIKSNRLFAG